MSAKTYKQILQVGLFLSLGVIFLVFSALLFPYITSKQISFNILMELLFPFWLVLVWKYPNFRPYKSLVTYGLIAYLAVILLTCFTGVDFNLSFWGDSERMLGLFHILHFFLFYLYLITAFRERKDWDIFLSLSVLIAFIQAIMVLFIDRIGTIGNTAYVSGYFIFNIFFALILITRHHWRLHWPLYLALIFIFPAFLKANTSGAIIGLATSILLLLFMLGFFAAKKTIRQVSLSVFIVSLAAIILLFSQYNQPWFKENRILSNLSSNKSTFQTRRLSWEGAARDFKNHPLLGTGHGNYGLIFDRQFDPSFFNYADNETYFDRAHNNLIDIISTTGLVGLLAYLSIFIFLIREWVMSFAQEGYCVHPGYKGKRARELMIITALVAAYFVQNLAVFDSLATYMGLMMVLAYLVFIRHERLPISEKKTIRLNPGTELGVLVSAFIIVLIIISNFNLQPYKMMKKTIQAYQLLASSQTEASFAAFEMALAEETVLDRDSRNILINFVANNSGFLLKSMTPEKANAALEYTISLAERNLAYNSVDSLLQMQIAQLYDIAARYHYQDHNLFQSYSDKALVAAKRSLAASPRRIPVYFVLGQIQANAGDLEAAEASFIQAHELNPQYNETNCQLANYYFLVKDKEYLDYSLSCLQGGSVNLVTELLVDIANNEDLPSDSEIMLLSYRALAAKGSKEPEVYLQLMRLESAAGNLDRAIEAAVIAGDLDETLRPEIKNIIKELEQLMSK